MTKRTVIPRSLTWALLTALVVAAPPADAAEVVAFGIDQFGTAANQCGSATTSDLSYSVAFAEVFADAFRDEGWSSVEEWHDAAVDGRDWIDVGKDPGDGADAVDPFGADHADVALLSSHGSHKHSADGYYSNFTMGDDDEECYASTRDDILFGDAASGGDLEVAILATCTSAHYDVWLDSGYFDVRTSNGKLSTWLGFHGLSYDSSTDRNRLEDYAQDSFFNGLGDNWLDEMHRNPWGADNTQCPTAVIFCEFTSDCDSQFTWGGFDDRFKVTASDSKFRSRFYYLDGCDPAGGPEL